MPGMLSTRERRKVRTGLKVLHRHRIGNTVYWRISDLIFVRGNPVAVPEWINLGGVRTPLYICELDPARLTQTDKRTYHYLEVTVDPRFEP